MVLLFLFFCLFIFVHLFQFFLHEKTKNFLLEENTILLSVISETYNPGHNILELHDIFQIFLMSHMKQSVTIEGTVMQIEKALINDRLQVSKVSSKFCIQTIYNFAII